MCMFSDTVIAWNVMEVCVIMYNMLYDFVNNYECVSSVFESMLYDCVLSYVLHTIRVYNHKHTCILIISELNRIIIYIHQYIIYIYN